MIVGYHIIFGTYGFWLPNDPRGSWSAFVGSWELFQYGPATQTQERRSLAYMAHDRATRRAAKSALKYPPVTLTGVQARAVARGFARYVERSRLPVWACAIMPDHVHLVVGRTAMKAEQLVIQLKGDASQELERQGIHPMARFKEAGSALPKCWAQGHWKVYLNPEDVDRAVGYVENNPLKDGKRKQTWSFVKPRIDA